ncbi:MAG: histidine phosphatase family protein [Janthinobacterium lividum]
MTRLTLICHAATEAARAARFPDDEVIDDGSAVPPSFGPPIVASHWLTGPEQRARSTAAALVGDRVIVVDPELRDWNCGRWRGQTIVDLQRTEPTAVAAWLADPAAAPHGGESLLALLGRVEDWLGRQAAVKGKSAAFTHPAILRAAIVVALGAGPAAFWRVDAQPLSRARLSHDGRRWNLQSLVPPSHSL